MIISIYASTWITAFAIFQVSKKYDFMEEPIPHLVASFFWWVTIWKIYP